MSITVNPETATNEEQLLLDGDPASIAVLPVNESGYLILSVDLAAQTGGFVITGIGIANHNLVGSYINVEGLWDNVYHDLAHSFRPTTPDDFVIPTDRLCLDHGTLQAATSIRLTIATTEETVTMGCLCLLADYGYNAAGVLTENGGFGTIALGGANMGGLQRPLPVAGDSGVRAVVSANGFIQYQQIAAPVQILTIPLSLMRAGSDLEMWRLWNAYYPTRRDMFCNPGFAKGVWYTSDEWSAALHAGKMCVGDPGAPLAYQIDYAGGRASGGLQLRTLARESVA